MQKRVSPQEARVNAVPILRSGRKSEPGDGALEPADELTPQAGDQGNVEGQEKRAADLLNAADVATQPGGGTYCPIRTECEQHEGETETEAVGEDEQ